MVDGIKLLGGMHSSELIFNETQLNSFIKNIQEGYFEEAQKVYEEVYETAFQKRYKRPAGFSGTNSFGIYAAYYILNNREQFDLPKVVNLLINDKGEDKNKIGIEIYISLLGNYEFGLLEKIYDYGIQNEIITRKYFQDTYGSEDKTNVELYKYYFNDDNFLSHTIAYINHSKHNYSEAYTKRMSDLVRSYVQDKKRKQEQNSTNSIITSNIPEDISTSSNSEAPTTSSNIPENKTSDLVRSYVQDKEMEQEQNSTNSIITSNNPEDPTTSPNIPEDISSWAHTICRI